MIPVKKIGFQLLRQGSLCMLVENRRGDVEVKEY